MAKFGTEPNRLEPPEVQAQNGRLTTACSGRRFAPPLMLDVMRQVDRSVRFVNLAR